MGEYAKYGRSEIKIGTCENMYYLRYDQIHAVHALPGNVDPVRDAKDLRFRFPWPDEDGTAPGAFNKEPDRGVGLPDVAPPEGVEHGIVQFCAPGYNVCLPCPESLPTDKVLLKSATGEFPLTLHRNGFPGKVLLTQQRVWEGRLVIVCRCGGCGYAYRLPELADAQPVIDACIHKVNRYRNGVLSERSDSQAAWWETVAERIRAGYALSV